MAKTEQETAEMVEEVVLNLARFNKKAACCAPGPDLDELFEKALKPAQELGDLGFPIGGE